MLNLKGANRCSLRFRDSVPVEYLPLQCQDYKSAISILAFFLAYEKEIFDTTAVSE